MSLYVVLVQSAQPHPNVTITDPAMRLANATELAAEPRYARPTSGYVYS